MSFSTNPEPDSGSVDTDGALEQPVRRRPIGWSLVALGVVALGCGLSVWSASGVARTDDVTARRTFEKSALEIAGSLRVAIQHEDDLVVSTGAFVAANPDVTSGELDRWLVTVRAQDRYPELLGVGAMRFVPEADLDEFLVHLSANEVVPHGPSGDVEVQPPGARPYYCLLQAVVAFGSTTTAVPAASPFGFDYCVGELGALLLAGRDSGLAANLAVPDADGVQLVVQTPVYRGGLVPNTLDERRAAYLGNFGTSLAPEVLFADVLRNEPDAMITLTFNAGLTEASFTNGETPPNADSVTQDFGNGWSATVSRAAPAHGLLSSSSAVRLIVAGSIASLLLGLLIYASGTGRMRAIRLVTRRTDELRHQALHDALTGLPNRTLILSRVEHLLARCRRHGTVAAALYIDLDGFKDVNDTLGHEAGDQLLSAVADRLTTAVRGVDTIGRMGGDEFVVLVEGGLLQGTPERVADRLLDVLRQPFDLELAARPIVVTASVGIAAGDRSTAGELLRDADIALYRAKAAGRNCYALFHPEMEIDVQHQFELELDLRSALEHHQFRLFYQPIYNLADLSIVGTEALLRWEHPTRGLLQPDEFIPLLESSGHIVEVGRWVLGEACRQTQTWLDQGSDLTISVNVSARQLDRDGVIAHVAEALATSKLDPARLTLEITETVLMKDAAMTARRLHALKALGVQLAIDDFGTGYSSLAYLQRFPVDCLKIDRVFTDAITRSAESDSLIHTLVQLGKDLGLKTLAEGIETTDQLDHLRKVSVDEGQGFLLARPLSAEAFESQLLVPFARPVVT